MWDICSWLPPAGFTSLWTHVCLQSIWLFVTKGGMSGTKRRFFLGAWLYLCCAVFFSFCLLCHFYVVDYTCKRNQKKHNNSFQSNSPILSVPSWLTCRWETAVRYQLITLQRSAATHKVSSSTFLEINKLQLWWHLFMHLDFSTPNRTPRKITECVQSQNEFDWLTFWNNF